MDEMEKCFLQWKFWWWHRWFEREGDDLGEINSGANGVGEKEMIWESNNKKIYVSVIKYRIEN